MKKALSILLAMGMTVSMMAGCGDTADNSSAAASTEAGTDGTQAAASAADIKVGVIYIGDENEGYTAAHMAGIDEMAANLGLSDDQIIEKTTIPEDESCYDAAVDLADQGCNIIFATSLDMRHTFYRQHRSIRTFSSVMQLDIRQQVPDFPTCTTISMLFMKHVMYPVLLQV